MSTTILLGASVMAPILGHSTTVMISPSNVYSLQGGVIDVRTADFSLYRGYRGPLRSVSASAFGGPDDKPAAGNEGNSGSRAGSPAIDELISDGGSGGEFSTEETMSPSALSDPPVVTPVAPVSTSTVSVPEPGSLGLMSAALLGLLAFRRRQIG